MLAGEYSSLIGLFLDLTENLFKVQAKLEKNKYIINNNTPLKYTFNTFFNDTNICNEADEFETKDLFKILDLFLKWNFNPSMKINTDRFPLKEFKGLKVDNENVYLSDLKDYLFN